VYALFCSQMLDHYKTTEAQWTRLENDLLPDLFDHTEQPMQAPAPAPTIALTLGSIEIREPTGKQSMPVATTTAAKRPEAKPAKPASAARPPAATPNNAFASSDWLARL